MDLYKYLNLSKQLCKDRIEMLINQHENYSKEFGLNNKLYKQLDLLFEKEYNILKMQIDEIDKLIKQISGSHGELLKEDKEKPKKQVEREPIVDPLHPLSTEPRINYNLNSNSHYWDIVNR